MTTNNIKQITTDEVLGAEITSGTERIYTASQTKLVLIRLFRHKLAVIGMIVLAIFYFCAIFAPFLSPISLWEDLRLAEEEGDLRPCRYR